MGKTVRELVADAKKDIDNLTPDQVSAELKNKTASLIDIRESEELQSNGRIPGAVHAPRGMLEFYADPNMPQHKPEFDFNKKIILHCAAGARSALAVQTLKQMGYANVAHLDGGFKAWKEAGKETVS